MGPGGHSHSPRAGDFLFAPHAYAAMACRCMRLDVLLLHAAGWRVVRASVQTLAFFIALPLTLGLLMLLIWHVQMVASNKTTIEYREVSARGRTCLPAAGTYTWTAIVRLAVAASNHALAG